MEYKTIGILNNFRYSNNNNKKLLESYEHMLLTSSNRQKVNESFRVVCKIYKMPGAARGLLSSRHLGVKITDFTDFHPILSVFQRYLRKLGRYFTPKRLQESPLQNAYLLLICACCIDHSWTPLPYKSELYIYIYKYFPKRVLNDQV